MRNTTKLTMALVASAVASPAAAQEQPVAGNLVTSVDMMSMSVSELKGEIGQRYDAALALTRDGGTVGANDPRYLWAIQAKAQCGIALGFLKSSTKDPVSIGKCIDAAMRMNAQPMPVAVQAPAVPVDNPACRESIAGIVFFEWDSAVPPESAMPIIQAAAQNLKACGWKGLTVTGHTDRSGSDAYNNGLSVHRAQAVSQMLGSQGADPGALMVSGQGESSPKVPTADGERNPQNRRVEITVQN
ncbi:OmpA family protein [Novosphingobium sp.]|uniref:OmpA family protein n=1 Tax=Novosphingobium sp. TaxID=1874826 RepID=UPI0025E5F7A8|nr:OmpA family protein [Novosphingobium sp.]